MNLRPTREAINCGIHKLGRKNNEGQNLGKTTTDHEKFKHKSINESLLLCFLLNVCCNHQLFEIFKDGRT